MKPVLRPVGEPCFFCCQKHLCFCRQAAKLAEDQLLGGVEYLIEANVRLQAESRKLLAAEKLRVQRVYVALEQEDYDGMIGGDVRVIPTDEIRDALQGDEDAKDRD